jgi:hypothetical protein
MLSLIYYYRAPYFPFEEADWRALGQYLETHAGPEDLVFSQAGRNTLYTIRYYMPDFKGPMKYLNTKNYPADQYQLEFRREYQTQPEILYQQLLGQYKHVWLVQLNKQPGIIQSQQILHPKSEQKFGPTLALYELE